MENTLLEVEAVNLVEKNEMFHHDLPATAWNIQLKHVFPLGHCKSYKHYLFVEHYPSVIQCQICEIEFFKENF